MKKWILLFLLFSAMTSLAQSGYNYTYTDPCTLTSKRIFVPAGSGVMVNYFGNNRTFSTSDFSTGAFESWLSQVSQQNSNSPCESVTTSIINGIANITVANTLTVVTNIISVTNVAQSVSTIGNSMTSTAGGITNSSQSEKSSTNQKSKDDKKSNSNTSTRTNTGTAGTSSTSNPSQASQTSTSTSGGTSPQSSTGTTQQGGNTSNSNQSTSTGSSTSESSVEGSSGSGSNLANSLSNAVDGGSADGGSTSGGSKKNNNVKSAGSLIASGDIVAIANTDQTQNFRFVGSITHANTRGTRIKGALFNFTSGVNNLNVTFYKSWINKSKKLNTVGAQSFMMDFDKNFFSTTTVLESYKVSNKLTGMFGLNFTAGKMGERSLLNMSAVAGAHSSFKVSDRVSTSILILGVYSPFTQFYEGKWWDAGLLAVPFNSWDLKITKTFKFNVSFTGVYQTGESFLNYQILTGGKLNF
jgi:hypothetical protein